MNNLATSLCAQLTGAELQAEPFDHIHIGQMFANNIYDDIQASMPALNSLYTPLDANRWAHDGVSTRDNLRFNEDILAKVPPIWQMIYAAFNTYEVKVAIFNKFSRVIAKRFSIPAATVAEHPSAFDLLLLKDRVAYELPPHRDKMFKIITLQIYLPSITNDQTDIGTSFYEPDDVGGFEEVKRFPYTANSAYAFGIVRMGERQSWHGVQKLGKLTEDRHSVIATWLQKREHLIKA